MKVLIIVLVLLAASLAVASIVDAIKKSLKKGKKEDRGHGEKKPDPHKKKDAAKEKTEGEEEEEEEEEKEAEHHASPFEQFLWWAARLGLIILAALGFCYAIAKWKRGSDDFINPKTPATRGPAERPQYKPRTDYVQLRPGVESRAVVVGNEPHINVILGNTTVDLRVQWPDGRDSTYYGVTMENAPHFDNVTGMIWTYTCDHTATIEIRRW